MFCFILITKHAIEIRSKSLSSFIFCFILWNLNDVCVITAVDGIGSSEYFHISD